MCEKTQWCYSSCQLHHTGGAKLSNYVSHKVLGSIIPLSRRTICRVTNCSLVKEIGRFNVQRTGSGGRRAEAAAIVDVFKLLKTLKRVGTQQSTGGRENQTGHPPLWFKYYKKKEKKSFTWVLWFGMIYIEEQSCLHLIDVPAHHTTYREANSCCYNWVSQFSTHKTN